MKRLTIAALAVAAAPLLFTPAFAQGGGGGGAGGGGGTGGTGGGSTSGQAAGTGGGTGGGAASAPTPDSAATGVRSNVSNGSVSSVDTAHPSTSLPTTEAGGGPERSSGLGGRVFRGVLHPEHNSTMTGLATIAPGQANGTTMVTLSVAGAPAGTYAWHVHVGRCGAKGAAILGDRSAYPPLHVDKNGKATERVTLGVEPPAGGNYHIVVHPPQGGEDQSLACAELLEAGV